MEFRIHPDVFTAHPGYCRGLVVLDQADNTGRHDALAQLLRQAEQAWREQGVSNVAELPAVVAWRDAYRRFGAKPSEHRSAVEALLRRAQKPDGLPLINPLVDIGNLVSVRFRLPAGVHPLHGLTDAPTLRPAQPGDRFEPPDGGPVEQPPAGELVLASGAQVLTRRWTWRQAASTQTLPATRRVFFNIDGLPPVGEDVVRQAMGELQRLCERFCGGVLLCADVLSASRPVVDVPLPAASA